MYLTVLAIAALLIVTLIALSSLREQPRKLPARLYISSQKARFRRARYPEQ
jgi:hypothetical protein